MSIYSSLFGSLRSIVAQLAPRQRLTVAAGAIGTVVAVVALTEAAWYYLLRRVEPHLPDFWTRVLLGSSAAPVYIRSDEHAVVAPRDVVIVAEPRVDLER